MGIIIRQSVKSTIVSYAGVALGALNTIVLFPRFFEADQFGLTRVLLSISTVLALLAEFGGTNVINKYFPVFKAEKDTLKHFTFWILVKALGTFAVISFVFFLFKNPILHGYAKTPSTLVHDFFGYFFPLALFLLIFNLLEGYARSMLRITFPTLLREVYLRVFLLVIILLFHFRVISFDIFILLFVGSFGTAMLIIAGYVAWLDRHFLKPSFAFARHEMMQEVFVYGLYSILTVGLWKVVTQLDIIMLSFMDTLANVGIYSIAFYIVTLTMLPQRFLHQISFPIISDTIRLDKWNEVKALYSRVGLHSFTIGTFVFLGIWVNLDNLLYFLPREFSAIHTVVFVLMMGRLFDMATSFNGDIILLSKYFRFNLWAGLSLLVMCIGTNLLFIPPYGILGAAIGTALSLTIFNVARTSFVYWRFGFLPFSTSMLKALVIGMATLAVALVIPDFENVYLNILVKSSVVTMLFPGLIYSLKVSEDINQFFLKAVEKVKVQLGIKN